MQILLGDASSKKALEIMKRHNIGRLFVQQIRTPYPGEPWGFDNGAWYMSKQGIELSHYDTQQGDGIGKFLVRLNQAMKIAQEYGKPYLAVLPDIVAGGDRSLEISLSWAGKICPGWDWYLPVQDGMTVSKVIDALPLVAGLFLGGSDKYKRFAGYWCKVAHHHKKKFHYARAGSMSKLAHACMIGADSIDTTSPLWTHSKLLSFIQELSQKHIDGITMFSPHPEYGTGGYGSLVQL